MTSRRIRCRGLLSASVRNYNRLVTLPAETRAWRMQALWRFPALLAPILLIVHRQPDCFGDRRHAGRDKDAAVQEATDLGRDLTGALAAHYEISRGLVRASNNAAYWHATSVHHRRAILTILDALPGSHRPTVEAFERWQVYLTSYFRRLGGDRDGEPLPQPPAVHWGAFRLGWCRTWESAARRSGNLHRALAHCKDFLRATRERARGILRHGRAPDTAWLATAWLAKHGLLGLLAASDRWDRLRPRAPAQIVPPGFALRAILGRVEGRGHEAVELLDPVAPSREGEAMRHYVATYWERCVDGDRIFALRGPDGERATTQYCLDIRMDVLFDTTYSLVQLRGPFNSAASAAMHRWAREIETRLNSPERREAHGEALEAWARPVWPG